MWSKAASRNACVASKAESKLENCIQLHHTCFRNRFLFAEVLLQDFLTSVLVNDRSCRASYVQ